MANCWWKPFLPLATRSCASAPMSPAPRPGFTVTVKGSGEPAGHPPRRQPGLAPSPGHPSNFKSTGAKRWSLGAPSLEKPLTITPSCPTALRDRPPGPPQVGAAVGPAGRVLGDFPSDPSSVPVRSLCPKPVPLLMPLLSLGLIVFLSILIT